MTTSPSRSSHPFFMHDAIYAQPGALRLVTRGNETALADAAARLAPLDRVIVTGVGSSWHAALAVELLLGSAGTLGHRARALHAFELTRYWSRPVAGTGIVAISHRGDTGPVREIIGDGNGAVSVVVTGKGSDLSGDVTLRTVTLESSSAHTVAYTTTLALLATLAAEMGSDATIRRELGEVPDHLATLLGQESWEEVAERFATDGRYWIVGGGPSMATALEGALKLQESAHATALGLECEQFLHGPWIALDGRDVVIVVAPPGPSYERCVAAARAARAAGTRVLAIVGSGDADLAGVATETIEIAPVPELLSPLLAVVPLQLLAYHTALSRGINPDAPAGDQIPGTPANRST
jgi:glucosamine--fructose-6-phosphate aminotransferase (isomerizing)